MKNKVKTMKNKPADITVGSKWKPKKETVKDHPPAENGVVVVTGVNGDRVTYDFTYEVDDTKDGKKKGDIYTGIEMNIDIFLRYFEKDDLHVLKASIEKMRDRF